MPFGTSRFSRTLLVAIALGIATWMANAGQADTFHVTVDGVDAADRDGRSPDTAWKSLAFACEQVPEGGHTIELGSGVFVATRAARPNSGVTIVGQGRQGEQATQIIAAEDWPLSKNPNLEGDEIPDEECLIVWRDVENVAIRDVMLASRSDSRISAAVAARDVKHGELAGLYVHDFRWAGLHLNRAEHMDVHHNRIENASTDKFRWHNGLVRTRWIKHSQIHHNAITSTEGGGYGYKGGGHEGVRIHHNYIDVAGGFSIESAHEHEFGVEIDHNYASRCISVPKGNQSADPNDRGFEYSFWIHDNLLTDSYTIEGPRNHLRVSHNYIRIERSNGRVYTHHGGENHGPVWIHHNLIENVDRALVWMNEGLAENIHVYNNTVFCAMAGDRADALFGAYTGERLNNWIAKNNIFVAPGNQPRKVMADQRDVPTKIQATDNLCVNLMGVPQGNHPIPEEELGLQLRGDKPLPYFLPVESSSLVDAGVDVGLPFLDDAPDLGAHEGMKDFHLDEIATIDVADWPVASESESQPRRKLEVRPASYQAAYADEDAAQPAPTTDDNSAQVPADKPSPNEKAKSPAAPTADRELTAGDPSANELVEVDWLEEAMEGGVTMIALAALSVFMLAAIAERMIMLRRSRFVPRRLVSDVLPLYSAGRFEDIISRCRKSRSTLGEVVEYLVVHRKAQLQTLAAGAGDLGARSIADEEQRLNSLAIVAGVAPLLGLLGTMIGMIESFKLVEIFGDEGGASLLAGSISKALITTAAGLVLAIPALFAHFAFKHRTHRIAHELEEQTERVFNTWFLDPDSGDAADISMTDTADRDRASDHATADPLTSGSGPV